MPTIQRIRKARYYLLGRKHRMETITVSANAPPTVSVTAPASGATVSGAALTISASASDDVAVAGVQFKIDGNNVGSEVTTAPYSIVIDTNTLSNAAHIITAVARDVSGATTTSSGVSVTVNNVQPLPDLVVTSLAYANGLFSCTILNQGTADTPTGIDVGVGYSVDGQYKTWGGLATLPLSAGASASIGTGGDPYTITPGTHTITAYVDDLDRIIEGNQSNNQFSITVNISAPLSGPVVSMTAPTNGDTVSGSTLTISATASDDIGVLGVQFKVDGVNAGAEVTTAPYSITFDTNTVANGSHTITATARDGDGLTNSSSVGVIVNNVVVSALPDVTVTQLSYANGIFTSTIVNQGTAPTPQGIEVGVGYSVDGTYRTYGSASPLPVGAGATVTVGTNGDPYVIPAGTHTITAYVDDVNRFPELSESNNQMSITVTTTPANVGPSVSVISPAAGSTVSGSSLTLTAEASDDVGVLGVQFKVDGNNVGSEITTTPYTTIFNTTTVPSGSHTITAVARDTDGALTTSSSVTVVVDNSVPLPDLIVTALSYAAGVFTCTIKNQGSIATPSGVAVGVGYSVDGQYKTWGGFAGSSLAAGASANIGTDGGSYVIPDGAHTVTAFVDDLDRILEGIESNNQFGISVNVGTVSGGITRSMFGPQPFTATSLAAGTKFASPNGTGNGLSVGSPASLRSAIASLVPGDVLFLRGGTYVFTATSLDINVVGTASNPVIIESYPGELAIIDGSALPWGEGSRITINGKFIRYRNIEITGMPAQGTMVLGSDNILDNIHSHHNRLSGLQIYNSESLNPDPNVGSRNVIKNCTIHDNSGYGHPEPPYRDGDESDGIGVSSGLDNRIENCLVYGNSDDGIDCWKSIRTYIGWNISHSNGIGPAGNGDGIKAGGSPPSQNAFVERNLCWNNSKIGFDTNTGVNITFRKNTGFGNLVRTRFGTDTIATDNISTGEMWGYAGIETNNSWQRGGTFAVISTDINSPNFLRPTVGGGFEDIGAYSA